MHFVYISYYFFSGWMATGVQQLSGVTQTCTTRVENRVIFVIHVYIYIWAVLNRCVEQVGHLIPFFYSKIWTYLLNRLIKLMIISRTIKFGSRKWRINVKNMCFLEQSNKGHQMFFGVLSIMPCTTAVNDFLGVLCATFGVSCSTMWTRNFFVSFLVLNFNVTTISCPMLRPLSCLTMFCDHIFSLVSRFNLQFSQFYMNIDTDEIQHWFCYFVHLFWNKNTIYERSNGRTF